VEGKNTIRLLAHKKIFSVGGSRAILIPTEVLEMVGFTDIYALYLIDFAINGAGEKKLYIEITEETPPHKQSIKTTIVEVLAEAPSSIQGDKNQV